MFSASIANKRPTESYYIELNDSGSGYLNYGYYYYDFEYVGYRIIWSFESSNSFVGITVLTMNHEEYDKYRSAESYIYYTLSDGNYVRDSGIFNVPYEDYWYIMFINRDSDEQQTYLTYEISYEDVNPFLFIMGTVVFIVVIGIVVVIIIVINQNKKSSMTISQPIMPQQIKNQNPYTVYSNQKIRENEPKITTAPDLTQKWLFCPYCGNRSLSETKFCVNCGRELESLKK